MEEYLNLDMLTLSDISIKAGKPIDRDVYLDSLRQAKSANCLFDVRKDGELHAYASLKDLGQGKWFVLMFVTHPDKRNRYTFGVLFGQLIEHLEKVGATTLISNVFKSNELSIRFHRKLGFEVTREAPQGYEFTLTVDSSKVRPLSRVLRSIRPDCR
ncbi:GNAT family N-acetyltransferase [Gynuella sunshinyii]|uniref:Sortase and related acyltransferase n=1 Tax=Gynuella sunshinyii YC6258 TaxID=1445510 RepID=A0A0C5VTM4_9GAMM|nr:GNAT family N-acetyltransferase [Gynuella sunshinyii]AJQ96653.1 sortase and related acyltransferase [Gynuella sunshinyii YC6258]